MFFHDKTVSGDTFLTKTRLSPYDDGRMIYDGLKDVVPREHHGFAHGDRSAGIFLGLFRLRLILPGRHREDAVGFFCSGFGCAADRREKQYP